MASTAADLWLIEHYDEVIKAIRREYPCASQLKEIDAIELWKQGAFPVEALALELQAALA